MCGLLIHISYLYSDFQVTLCGPWDSDGVSQGCVGGSKRASPQAGLLSALCSTQSCGPQLLYVLDFPVIFPLGGKIKFKNRQLSYALVTSD